MNTVNISLLSSVSHFVPVLVISDVIDAHINLPWLEKAFSSWRLAGKGSPGPVDMSLSVRIKEGLCISSSSVFCGSSSLLIPSSWETINVTSTSSNNWSSSSGTWTTSSGTTEWEGGTSLADVGNVYGIWRLRVESTSPTGRDPEHFENMWHFYFVSHVWYLFLAEERWERGRRQQYVRIGGVCASWGAIYFVWVPLSTILSRCERDGEPEI